MLLLEVGIWDSLSNIVLGEGSMGLSNREVCQRLVERRMSQPEQAMGAKYADATRACFKSSFLPPYSGYESVLESYAALHDAFKRSVGVRIGICKV
ncbi:hypothetical protein BDR22DRAFT_848275 [Usnea florida]